ncbi:hypothetical protein H6F86_26645 [Phormidium sp. FACHB-592]|nr:hypothetical protein [Phormidium sp. FACHB-592]
MQTPYSPQLPNANLEANYQRSFTITQSDMTQPEPSLGTSNGYSSFLIGTIAT